MHATACNEHRQGVNYSCPECEHAALVTVARQFHRCRQCGETVRELHGRVREFYNRATGGWEHE